MPTVVRLPRKDEFKAPIIEYKKTDRIINDVTFFGDSALTIEHPVYKEVYELAKILAKKGYGIVNGGGPGVMEAATSGAEAVNGHTVAVYWEPKLASHFEGKKLTNITDESESYSNYLMRTLGLIEKGQAYIVCQGGTGTVSEFGMVWALAKLYFGRHKPVILFGDFWKRVVHSMIDNLLIDDEEKGVLYFADKPKEVLDLLEMFEEEAQSRAKKHFEGDETAFIIDARPHQTRLTYEKTAKLYHEERAGKLVAQKQLDEFMELVPHGGKVLDVGTGPGYDLGYLSQKYQMYGIEMSKEFVDIARFENPEADIVCADIVHCILDHEKYDGIWSRDALHHIPEKAQDKVFKKLADALVPGGILYIIVQRGEGESVQYEQREKYDMNRFYHYYSEEELQERGTKAGLKLMRLEKTMRSHEWLIAVYKKEQ